MVDTIDNSRMRWDFIGLSTDEKPTPENDERVVAGSTYYCSDTSKLYVWYDNNWWERLPVGSTYTLPVASHNRLGGVKIGDNLSIDADGVLSADATSGAIMGVEVNGSLLIPDEDGVVDVEIPEVNVPVKSISVNDTPVSPDQAGNVDIEIPEVNVPVKSISVNDTTVTPDVNGNVNIDVPDEYTLPTASNNTLGGVKIGDNLSIDADGVLSADATEVNKATDDTLGTVKLNSDKGITLNENEQLEINGRLGQTSSGGLYAPKDANPTQVGAYSLLQTDAKSLSIGSRTYAIMGGNNITLTKSHPAGSTEYTVVNNYANRIAAMSYNNGRATLNNDTAGQYTVKITSVKFANGDPIDVYSGTNAAHGNIVITTETSANPDSATNKIRFYGTNTSTDVLNIGQCNGGTGGKVLEVGMHLTSNGNQVMVFGNGCFSNANNSGALGRNNINKKQSAFLLGEGHDSSNGANGVTAVGLWSDITSNTAFAVGVGTSDTVRKNAIEVSKNGEIIVPSSTSGSTKKFKITVDDTGTISATEVV